jgi:hydroxymethylglutaryl-CoA reductase (NADPH)
MQQLEAVKQEFFEGKIKTQNLETEVFKRVYASDADKVAEACAGAAEIRCEFLEKKSGASLPLIKGGKINTSKLIGGETILAGIESKIGAALIPMGFAGPTKIRSQYVAPEEEIYIPLATNEAALIAGIQRGLKAINMAGGLKTLVHFDAMARAPLMEAPDIYAAREFIDFIEDSRKGNRAYIDELQQCVPDPFIRLVDQQFYFYKTYDKMPPWAGEY